MLSFAARYLTFAMVLPPPQPSDGAILTHSPSPSVSPRHHRVRLGSERLRACQRCYPTWSQRLASREHREGAGAHERCLPRVTRSARSPGPGSRSDSMRFEIVCPRARRRCTSFWLRRRRPVGVVDNPAGHAGESRSLPEASESRFVDGAPVTGRPPSRLVSSRTRPARSSSHRLRTSVSGHRCGMRPLSHR